MCRAPAVYWARADLKILPCSICLNTINAFLFISESSVLLGKLSLCSNEISKYLFELPTCFDCIYRVAKFDPKVGSRRTTKI